MAPRATLFLIRHAVAVARGSHRGHDEARPLTSQGAAQVEEMTRRLAENPIETIISSPARRCLDTMAPLAAKLGIPVTPDRRLNEAGPAGDLVDPAQALRLAGRADAVVREVAQPGAVAALCSHGDLIFSWLQLIRARDDAPVDPNRCAKGSIWELALDGSRAVAATYHRAP